MIIPAVEVKYASFDKQIYSSDLKSNIVRKSKMAAKEAEQIVLEDENEELREDLAPGDCGTAMLIVSDSYESLNTDEIANNRILAKKKGHIHDIVRQTSQEHDSSGGEQSFTVNHVDREKGTPSASEDSSDHSDVR